MSATGIRNVAYRNGRMAIRYVTEARGWEGINRMLIARCGAAQWPCWPIDARTLAGTEQQRQGGDMNDESTPDKRRRRREYLDTCFAIHQEWRERGYQYPPPLRPPFPDDLRGMCCGAKTKAGTPCKQTAIYASGRCKWHGGCSTGPTTEAGKQQSRINGKKGGRPKSKPDS